MIAMALGMVLGCPAPLDNGWKTFLSKGDKAAVQMWQEGCESEHPPKTPGFFQLSRVIEENQLKFHTNKPYTIPSRTRNGKFMIMVASDQTKGTMDSLDDNGHKTTKFGETDKDEPLVIEKDPLLTIGAWRPYDDDFMLFEYDYYFRVWRIMRCGNGFYTVCHKVAFGLVPRKFVKTHTEEEFENALRKEVEESEEAPCLPTPPLTIEYPSFGFGSEVQAPESSSTSEVLVSVTTWTLSGGRCKIIRKSKYCPPITGETPPPSQAGPPSTVTTAPNPFEGPDSDISTPVGPTNSGVKNANGGGH